MTDFAAVEAGIRQLHARCADAIWRKDADALGDCFAADAVWQLSAGVRRGRPDIVTTMRGGFANFRHIFMSFGSPLLALDAGGARARTYVTERGVRADGEAYLTIGIYYERFACGADGRWRFAWRQFQTGYSGAQDLSGGFPAMPDYGPPPAMPGSGT
jgi:ketosteroid isomerase-like protein